MEYRVNRKTGDRISVIGFGTSSFPGENKTEAADVLCAAYENGINYYDLASASGESFPIFGKALSGVRKNVFYQIHFGADYTNGSYGWTIDLDTIKRSVEYQLKALNTDYIDYGFIHCIDEEKDFISYQNNGISRYIQALKEEGTVRHIGLSSHTPSTVNKILDHIDIDMLMFSINPAYDYEKGDELGIGSNSERETLYRRCEAEGIGISVMKVFCGGQLLDERTSPFGKSLTELQCIQYALDKPGVLTVLPGVSNKNDLEKVLSYLDARAEDKDYSVISEFTPESAIGKCVYCNHCQPCPGGLDIALINKYYDLTRAGDAMAAQHYINLELKADDCVSCGHCNSRCPFQVDQMARMWEIKTYFGNN